MDTPHHLILRPSGYYFRLVVPEALRPYFHGKVEVRRSLRTASRYIALRRAARLWAHLQHEFEKVAMASGKNDGHSSVAGQWSAGELHFPNGVTLKNVEVKDAEDQENLERFIEKGAAMALNALQARAPTTTPVLEPTLSAPRWTARLGILIEKFLDEHKSKKTSADQHNKYVAALGLMAEIIGDKDINHVSIDDVNLVRETLRKVPTHRNNTAIYKGKSLRECIALADELDKPRLDLNTVDFSLQKISAFFEWAKLHEHLSGPNRFQGKTYRSRRERQESSDRTAFTEEDLQAIFRLYPIKDPALWWLCLMGLFTGARIGELAQMYRRDIRTLQDPDTGQGILTFFIRNEQKDQSLKNSNAKRLVPVHSQLLGLGLLDFVADIQRLGHERLFPNIPMSSKVTYATEASKRFGRFLDEKVGITDPGKVFHSFRYTMLDAVKQAGKVDYELRCEVSGHGLDNVASEVYTNQARIGLKKRTVESIQYEGLDLSGLKYRPGQFDAYFAAWAKREKARLERKAKKEAAKEKQASSSNS